MKTERLLAVCILLVIGLGVFSHYNRAQTVALKSNYGIFINEKRIDYPILNVKQKVYEKDLLREFKQGNTTPIDQQFKSNTKVSNKITLMKEPSLVLM
ncbi:MAG: hypothetical protein ACRCTA_01160, partial [Bacilli bacterium]